ncbi:MAG TPA: TlpA disulfide reductase family protein [Tepidisphaeraceae bacterium]
MSDPSTTAFRIRPMAFHSSATGVGLILLCCAAPTMAQSASPADRLAAARGAIRQTADALDLARKKPPGQRDEAEVERAFGAYGRAIDAAMATAVEIIQAGPASEAGFDACELLLTQRISHADGVRAIETVTRFHATDPRVATIVARVGYYCQVPHLDNYHAGTRLFEVVQKANADRTVRAQLAMARARRAVVRFELAEYARQPDVNPFTQKAIDASRLESGPDLDSDRAAADAIVAFKAVVRDYPDVPDLHTVVPPPVPVSLAQVASQALYELEHLRVGLPAPLIEGIDLEGRPYRLSDERGKVVLLVFWASWCAPCMAAVPHERELATKFTGRPFVFVGVNGDSNREHALRVQKDQSVPGRSFWNGPDEGDGPIAKAWNVSGWPTVYVIDAAGTIRHKNLHDTALDGPLDRLVAEAEAKPAQPDVVGPK